MTFPGNKLTSASDFFKLLSSQNIFWAISTVLGPSQLKRVTDFLNPQQGKKKKSSKKVFTKACKKHQWIWHFQKIS